MPDELTHEHLRDAATLAVALADPRSLTADVLAEIMESIADAGGVGLIAQAQVTRMLAGIVVGLVDTQVLADTELLLACLQRAIGGRAVTCDELGLTVDEALRRMMTQFVKAGVT